MHSIFSSATERNFLDNRKVALRKLLATEKYGITAHDQIQLQNILGFSSSQKKKNEASSFVRKVLLSSPNMGLSSKQWYKSKDARSLIPRIFNETDEQALLFNEHSLSKQLNNKEIIAFLRTIMNYQRIFMPQLGFKARAIRHNVVGRVSYEKERERERERGRKREREKRERQSERERERGKERKKERKRADGDVTMKIHSMMKRIIKGKV